MTTKEKRAIRRMTYEELLRLWRFAPAGDAMFQGENCDYVRDVLGRKRAEIGTSGAIEVSKRVGWHEPVNHKYHQRMSVKL